MSRRRSMVAAAVAFVLLGTGLGGPVGAELDSEAAAGTAGVVNRIPGDIDFQRYLIRDIEVGNARAYVGGFFLDLTDSRGNVVANQSFVGAFNAAGTAIEASFVPNVNGPVNEVELSPDGSRLFIGGEFTMVDGVEMAGVAALDPITGALQTDWTANTTWRFPTGKFGVDALEAGDRWLYVGGNFTDLVDSSGTSYDTQRLYRIDMTTGLLDETWRPTAQTQKVASLELSQDRSRLYVGGAFSSLNNDDASFRFGVLDTVAGDLIPGLPQGTRIHDDLWTTSIPLGGITNRPEHYPFDILEFGNYLAWTGDRTVMILDRDTLEEVWSFNRVDGCELDGDPQVMEFFDGYLYVGGHFEAMEDPAGNPCGLNPGGIFRWNPVTESADPDFKLAFDGFAPSIWGIRASGDSLFVGGVFAGIGGVPAASFARLDSIPDAVTPPVVTPPVVPPIVPVVDPVDPVVPPVVPIDPVTPPVVPVPPEQPEPVVPAPVDPTTPTPVVPVPPEQPEAVVPAPVADGERPSTPTGLSATALPHAVQLAWAPSTDNVGVVEYRIMRAPESSPDVYELAATVPWNQTTYDDALARKGRVYDYHVFAVDAAGNQSWRSGSAFVTTPNNELPIDRESGERDVTRPDTPYGLWVEPVTGAGSTVVMKWDGAYDHHGTIVSFEIYRSSVADELGEMVGTTGGLTFIDDSASPGQWYYSIKATDDAGNQSWRSGQKTAVTWDATTGPPDTTQPSIPTELAAWHGADGIELSWAAATDDTGVVRYVVYRSTAGDQLGQPVGQVIDTYFVDNDLPHDAGYGSTYWYSVKAEDAAGNSSWRPGSVAAS